VGWESGTLAEYAHLNPECWSRLNFPERINYIDLSGTKWGTIESIDSLDRDEAPSRAQRILRPGDTIVGTVRPGNGSYALVGKIGLTGSTGFSVLRPKRPKARELVYLAPTAPENIDRLAHLADGAAYPAVRPEVVLATETFYPSETLMEALSVATGPLIDRLEANKQESITLAATRDLLLPRLMSGEIRVKDAEKIAEAEACSGLRPFSLGSIRWPRRPPLPLLEGQHQL
jgi:type I restriction enzyme, S subunit